MANILLSSEEQLESNYYTRTHIKIENFKKINTQLFNLQLRDIYLDTVLMCIFLYASYDKNIFLKIKFYVNFFTKRF